MPLSFNEIRKKAEILVQDPDWQMTGISDIDRARIEARADQLRRTNANNIGGALKRTKKRVYRKNKTKKPKKPKKPKKLKKKSKTKKRSLLRKLFL